jgi:hypothetical protein
MYSSGNLWIFFAFSINQPFDVAVAKKIENIAPFRPLPVELLTPPDSPPQVLGDTQEG